MSSEVEGLPLAGAGRNAESAPPVQRAKKPGRLHHLLRRPFRSVLEQQATFNRRLLATTEELRSRQDRLERETARALGDLHGRLLGEIAELQMALNRMESRLGNPDEPERGVPAPGPTAPSAHRSERLPDGAGINLVGDITATTGLAQAGRRLAVGLQRRGVPLTVRSLRSGAPRIDDLFPTELRSLPNGTPHQLDLVTLNVNEVSTLANGDLGLVNTGRYAIGAWYWEFETLSPELVEQVGRVDEIWAPTTFVERSLGRYTSNPISIVPTIVPVFEASAEPARMRHRWKLADDEVVFLFTFDFNSSVVRKNPLGVVDAYRRAFGTERSGTRLVIKAINLGNSALFESDLREAVDGVGGVLIDERLSQQELGDLFHCADVYVSLHRSEGFGLGMAEAMAIGKAVIGTAYSGNVDFMNGSNSCPVGYRLREIIPDDHRYSEAVGTVYRPGFACAEPDIEQAARWMRALAADAGLRCRIGAAATATMATRFSEAAVLDAAIGRLKEIWQ